MTYKGVTKEDRDRHIGKMKDIMKRVENDGEEARRFLYEAGIVDENGYLRPEYGGKSAHCAYLNKEEGR